MSNTDIPSLKIYLLGAPRVEWGERPFAIQRRNVRGLLYRLAADLELVPRSSLCMLFWPDIAETVSRRNLTHLITHLRLALPDGKMLLSIEDKIGLDAQKIWCDTLAFRGFTHDNPSETKNLRQAVDLYREPFLTGFSLPNSSEFEQWALLERNSLENLYLNTLESLVDRELIEQHYEQAIHDTLRYLETDDLAEEMHRKLMVLYATIGDRNAALKQYERCVTALERELGVSPLPNTRAIYQSMLEGHAPDLTEPGEPKKIKPQRASLQDFPLVGREPIWQNLKDALNRARSGLGSLVFISGEAGIGKTRLMKGFVTGFQSTACILYGSGYSGGQTIPYLPLVEALRSIKGRLSLYKSLNPVYLADISRLLPELRSQLPDLPAPLSFDLEEARIRLFEALSRLIIFIASASPVTVLCVDDLQWVDQTTLEWLAYFCRQYLSKGYRLLILASYRDDEVATISEWYQIMSRLGNVTDIKLSGLDEQAIRTLVNTAFTNTSVNDHQIRLLINATGGNPLFLKELLISLAESGSPGNFERFSLPKGIKEAITERLQKLDAATRQILEASAVFGSVASFDGISLTAGRSEMETLESLDRLCAHHILLEDKDGYRFAHDLFHQAVETGLSPVRQQLLHRRAGRSLEKLDPNAVAAIAYQFEAGGEFKTAFHYHDLAAQKALSLFAWQEAVFHQGRMLYLLDQIDPRSKDQSLIRQRGIILAERAKLSFLQNRIAERDADLSTLSDLADASGDVQLRLITLVERVIGLNYSGRYVEAAAEARKGKLLAESLGDQSARLCFLAQLGLGYYHMGEPRAALSALEPAWKLSKKEHNLEMRSDITQFLGHVHFHLGNYMKALDFHLESLECCREMDRQTGQVWCSLNVGFIYLKLGFWEKSQECLHQCLALARQINMSAAEGFALTLLGQWELYRGNYLSATNYFLEALPIHQAARAEHNIAATEEPLGLVYYQLGNRNKAQEWLQSALQKVQSIGYRRLYATVLVDLGLIEIANQQLNPARNFLVESIKISRECECQENLAKGLAALARLEREAGNLNVALDHAQEALQVAKENVLPVCQMWADIEAGQVLLEEGKYALALEYTSQAVTLLPQAHEAWIGTEQVHFAHARCLRVCSQAERAAEHERLANLVIEVKAEKIADSAMREQFLAWLRTYSD